MNRTWGIALFFHIFDVPIPGLARLCRRRAALIAADCGIEHHLPIFYAVDEAHVTEVWHAPAAYQRTTGQLVYSEQNNIDHTIR